MSVWTQLIIPTNKDIKQDIENKLKLFSDVKKSFGSNSPYLSFINFNRRTLTVFGLIDKYKEDTKDYEGAGIPFNNGFLVWLGVDSQSIKYLKILGSLFPGSYFRENDFDKKFKKLNTSKNRRFAILSIFS